jgi:hypothetical protein
MPTVLNDAVIWVHDQDFTTVSNQVNMSITVEDQDATVFGTNGYRARLPGLRNVEANIEGLLDAPQDNSTFTNISVVDHPITIAPASTEGGKSYIFQGGRFNYELFGAVGEIAPFSLDLQGSNTVGAVRATIAKAKGDVSATGVIGTGQNLGNVATGQFLYGALHVFSAGTTITVVLESDDNAGFTTATTRATFGPITAAGGYWAVRVAGPLTETHYRFRVTAITGTFSVAGSIGIQ